MTEPRREGRVPRRAAAAAARASGAVEPLVRLAAVLAPALLAIALYLPALSHGFVHDDHALVETNALVQPGAPLAKLLTSDFFPPGSGAGSGMWRPLVLLSYRADRALGHGGAPAFHAGNVAAHAASTALVAGLALELAGPLAAFAAGAWFAVMPAHAESVAWVSGRTDVLCALFFLAALLADRRARRAGRAWCGPLALAMLALALLAKEMAVVFVPVLAVAEWAERRTVRDAARWLAPAAALTLAWGAAHVALVHPAPVLAYADAAMRARARLAALTLFPRELAFLWPWYPHSPQVAVALPPASGSPAVAAGALALAAGLAAVALAAWRRARVALPLALLVLGLLPVAAAMWSAAYLAFGERVLYLPSAGAALALALGVDALERRPGAARWAGRAGVLVLVVGSAIAAAALVPAWRDEAAFADALVATQPENPNGHLGRAERLAADGRLDEAMAELDVAGKLNPRLPEVPLARANVWMHAGDWPQVLAEADRAIALEPGHRDARTLRALALLRLRRAGEAESTLRALLAEAPDDLDAVALWGQCQFVSGHPDVALPFLERVAASRADDPVVQFALGQCHAQLGHAAAARAAFERCVVLDPADGASWHRLADMRRATGDAAGADAALARANALLGAGGAPAR